MKRWLIAIITCLSFATIPTWVHAAVPDRGLFITPSRQYTSVSAGQTTSPNFTVANLTKSAMNVSISVEQFSVSDYSYDYIFHPAKEDWIFLEKAQLSLTAGHSQKLNYTIKAPADALPGGHYFTIFASTKLPNGEKVRAATVVYVTVKGNLITTSNVENDTFPLVAFDGDINFKLNIRDTGNTHFFVYTIGSVSNGLVTRSLSEAGHILLPQTIRSLDYKITSPILPSIYRADYGYKTETGQVTNRTRYFLYLPVWSIMLVASMTWLIIIIVRRLKRRKTTGS